MNYLEISILFVFILFLILLYFTNLFYNLIISTKKLEKFDNHLTEQDVEVAKQQLANTQARLEQARADFKKFKEAMEAEKKKIQGDMKAITDWENKRKWYFNKFQSHINYLNNLLDSQIQNLEKIEKKVIFTEGGKDYQDNPDSNYSIMKNINDKFASISNSYQEKNKIVDDLANKLKDVDDRLGSSRLYNSL
jgi:ABC-type Na+ efflux pump permease subunit